MDDGKIRVLVGDEQALFREAMRVVLSSQGDLEVVAEARDGLQAISEAERHRPDVALLHAALPNCDGIRATSQIVERVPECRVVVMTDADDEHVLLDALEAGAAGYVSKESPLTLLIDAARTVHRGEALVPPQLLRSVIQRLLIGRRERDDALRRLGRLTRREREVLGLLSSGADNEDIARHLVISPETARTHIQNLMAKLGVHTRLEAAALVVQNGLVDELETAS